MITIQKYQIEIDKDAVRAFLQQTVNATIFNYPHFFEYHSPEKLPIEKYEPCHLIFRQDSKIIAFLTGYKQRQDDHTWIYKSPCMASYGGLVFDKSLRYKDLESVFEAWIRFLQQSEIVQAEFTPLPEVMYLEAVEKSHYIHYLLLKYNFLPIQSDIVLSHKIDISLPIEKQINAKTHTELKQAFKNELTFEVQVGVEADSYALLLQSQERLGSMPTHSFEDLQRLTKLFPESIYQIKIYKEEVLVSGIVVFSYNSKVLNTFYIYDSQEGRVLKANHFAYYHLIHWAGKQGYQYVDFGPSTFGYTAHNSLIDFKEKWACLPSLRTKYQVKITPTQENE